MTNRTLSLALVLAFGACAGGTADQTGSGGASGAGSGGTSGAGSGGASGTGSGGTSAAGSGGAGGGGGATGTGGAGGSAAGGAGGGNPDASTGGSGPCDAPGILVCDDFEGGMKMWTMPSMAQVTLDMTQHHSGTTSIKVMGSSTPSNHISTPAGTVFPNNSFYVRTWVYFEKSTAQINGHVAYIVGATTEDNSGTEARIGSSNNLKGVPMLDFNLQPPDSSQFSNGDINGIGGGTSTPGVSFNAATWYCIEAYFNGDGANAALQVWVNETEVTGLHVTDWGGQGPRAWAPQYKLVKVGGQNYSGSIGNVWYDDVAVGTQRIHCNQ
jgi:hypothetical protein